MKPLIQKVGRRPATDRLFGYAAKLSAGDRLILTLLIFALFGSLIWALASWSTAATERVPAEGGSLTEGIVGTPRFINPVLAITRADRDMAALVYAGLARLGEDGTIVPDVAESITISDDGLVYNVILRSDVVFHDGVPLTAEDVAFTIERIQNPAIQSPLRANWDGVTVEVIGEHELNFILPRPYAPFIENLTVGILPHHIWSDASNEEFPFSQYNSEPIGAGPYKIAEITRDTSGIPESYTLKPHERYHRGAPNIGALLFHFYPNEAALIEAFNQGTIEAAAALSPSSVAKLNISENSHRIVRAPLPRTFAVFFNQNKSVALRDRAARNALDTAVDRNELIQTVLEGYGVPLHSPIPSGFGIEATSTAESKNEETASSSPLDAAREILREGGWNVNEETGIWEKEIDGTAVPLSFDISTSNAPVFEKTAEFLRTTWEKLGVAVTVKEFEQTDLTQTVIRPREYQALLFGTALGRALDLYSFWHSSQRNDPGLNVALYANITTDGALEDARTTASTTARQTAFRQFAAEVEKETPAVFLYAPQFIYVLPNSVANTSFEGLARADERFANISQWYIDTDMVWPFFKN